MSAKKKKKSISAKMLSASESTGGYNGRRYRDPYGRDDRDDGGGYYRGSSRVDGDDDYYSRYRDPLSRRSGYGYDYHDDGYGHHGGGGHGADKYGSYTGYGHHGHKKECCPLVVKPLVFLALLGSLAAATAFLNVLITMNIGRKRRRRRRRKRSASDSVVLSQEVDEGGRRLGINVFLDRLLDAIHKGRKEEDG